MNYFSYIPFSITQWTDWHIMLDFKVPLAEKLLNDPSTPFFMQFYSLRAMTYIYNKNNLKMEKEK